MKTHETITLYYHGTCMNARDKPFATARKLSDAFDIALALVAANARSVRVERLIMDEDTQEVRGEWFSFNAVTDESGRLLRSFTDHGNLPGEDDR